MAETPDVFCAWCEQTVQTQVGSTGWATQLYKKNHNNKAGRPCSGGQTAAYGRPKE